MSSESDRSDHYAIHDAVSGIFIGYGARVALSNTDPPYMRIVLEDFKIAVSYDISDHPPDTGPITDLLDLSEDTFFHFHVFITNHPISRDIAEFSRLNDVILIGRDDLESELGKAHLADLEMFTHPRVRPQLPNDPQALRDSEKDGDSLIRQSVEAVQENGNGELVDERPELIRVLRYYQEKNTPTSNERHQKDTEGHANWVSDEIVQEVRSVLGDDPFSSSSNGSDDDLDASPSTQPNPLATSSPLFPFETSPSSEEAEPASIPKYPPVAIKKKGTILAPKIRATDLPPICTDILPITNSQMELIPYHLFSFTCTTIVEGSGIRKPRAGLVAVNGVTMGVEEWEADFLTVEHLPMDYIRLDPRADEKVAKDLALNGVVKINTRTLIVKTEEKGRTVNHNRKIFPDTSTIKLDSEGLHYFPHWHVRGEMGSMFVDAVNGDVISSGGDDRHQST